MPEISDELYKEFGEIAEHMAKICNNGSICPSPLYRACPFKHVFEKPNDCVETTPEQWIVLLDKLADLEGTI